MFQGPHTFLEGFVSGPRSSSAPFLRPILFGAKGPHLPRYHGEVGTTVGARHRPVPTPTRRLVDRPHRGSIVPGGGPAGLHPGSHLLEDHGGRKPRARARPNTRLNCQTRSAREAQNVCFDFSFVMRKCLFLWAICGSK